MTASYKNLQKSDSPPRLGGSNGNSLQAGRPGCSRPESCLRSGSRWEKNRVNQRPFGPKGVANPSGIDEFVEIRAYVPRTTRAPSTRKLRPHAGHRCAVARQLRW